MTSLNCEGAGKATESKSLNLVGHEGFRQLERRGTLTSFCRVSKKTTQARQIDRRFWLLLLGTGAMKCGRPQTACGKGGSKIPKATRSMTASVYSCCRVVGPSASFLSPTSVAVHVAFHDHWRHVPELLDPFLFRSQLGQHFRNVHRSMIACRGPINIYMQLWHSLTIYLNSPWTTGTIKAQTDSKSHAAV
jgi:hypothetical protein